MMMQGDSKAGHDVGGKSSKLWLVYALLCIVCWGAWGALSKVVSEGVDPFRLQALYTVGFIPLAVVVVARNGWNGIGKDRFGILCGVFNGVLTALGALAFYAALAQEGASLVAPIAGLFPLLTIVLAALFLKERMNRVQAAGAVLAIAAIVILST